jgi:hypothetical protein
MVFRPSSAAMSLISGGGGALRAAPDTHGTAAIRVRSTHPGSEVQCPLAQLQAAAFDVSGEQTDWQLRNVALGQLKAVFV